MKNTPISVRMAFIASVTCCLLLLPFITEAQQKFRLAKAIRFAEKYLAVQEYHNAVEIMQQAVEKHPKDPKANYLMGVALLYSSEDGKGRALKYLEVTKSSEQPFEHLEFYMGRAEHHNLAFDQAIDFYEKAKRNLTDRNQTKEVNIELINRLIQQCKVGKRLVADPLNVSIKNLGPNINTTFPELSPVVSADETKLIFTSRRNDGIDQNIDPMMNMPYEDLYQSEKLADGKWSKPVRLNDLVNTDGHDASIGLSPDGSELFIYKGEAPSANKMFSGNIYVTQYIDGDWAQPTPLPDGINTEDWENHATITSDKQTMYITSNRDGGLGGTDIYRVRKLPNGQWATPENLGPNINTEFNEEAPFVHPDGHTLYFASEGHETMGGFDIFYSVYDQDKKEWSKPINYGYPINSPDDDVFFSVSADGSRAYFSSVREEGEGHDIYIVNIPERELNILLVKGVITDKATGKPMVADISVYDNTTRQLVQSEQSSPEDGKYALYLDPKKNYGIRVQKDGYLFKSINIDIPDQFEYLELAEDFAMQAVDINKIEPLNNVFFTEENDIQVNSDPELEVLKKLVESYPKYVFEIAVHLDVKDQADSLLAKVVTQARADAILQELRRLGAYDQNITSHGYGYGYAFNYTQAALVRNAGRLRNTRVEYIVRKSKPEDPMTEYAALFPEKYDDRLKEMNFQCPPIGKTLNNVVYYNPDDNQLDETSLASIDKVAEILRLCPDIKIEVSGHSDAQAEERFANAISDQKARRVAQQIFSKDIDNSRLVISSFGSTVPKAPNDTEENRRKNRRIEFKVVNSSAKTDNLAQAQDDNTTPELPTADILNAQANASTSSGIDRQGNVYEATRTLDRLIFFSFASERLDQENKKAVEAAIAFLKENPNVRLEVAGHTDNLGNKDYNKRLAERRAKRVVESMQFEDISADRLIVKSYGSDEPIASNQTEEGRAKNRRVAFRVVEE